MQPHHQTSDNELIEQLRMGDKYAFAEIYNRYIGSLQKHAYKKLGNFDEAKDILQDLFTSLWNNRETLPLTSNLAGYLYKGMRNRILNSFARKEVAERYTESLLQFTHEGHYGTDLLMREKELTAIIEAEINQLPEKMRGVFVLSRQEHLSHKEIANLLSISEQTVSKQVTNALKILRLRLGSLFLLIFLLIYR